jgi:S1-C subfamily serine protease
MRSRAIIWFFSLFLLSFFNLQAFAQLPDFTEMVKTNGGAVVNISTTQKAPSAGAENGAEMPAFPEGSMPPELEEFFRRFNEQQQQQGQVQVQPECSTPAVDDILQPWSHVIDFYDAFRYIIYIYVKYLYT